MVVSSAELLGLLGLLFYFGLAGFAWLIPLRKYLGNWGDALKLSIPVSISIQILFGYIFYTFNTVIAYPFLYFAFVLIVNALAVSGLGKKFWPKPKKIKIDRWALLATVVVVAAFVYTRFFDAFSTTAPGAIDAFSHLRFVRDLSDFGHLSAVTYAPGFHLLMYPANLIFGDAATYRFVGPVLGLLTGLSVWLLIRKELQSVSAKLLIPALLTFPILVPLSLQTISFFPTALTFIIFPAVLSPLLRTYKEWRRIKWLLMLMVLGLSVSVPYLFIQAIPPFVALAILLWFFRSKIPGFPSRAAVTIGITLTIGLFAALGHSYLQSKLFSTVVVFPTNDLVDTNLLFTTFSGGANEIRFIDTTNPLYYNFLYPLFTSAWDVVSIKDIRSLNSIFSIGAYLWGALSIGVLIWALRKKFFDVAIVSYLCIFFVIVTQTGLFEISTYRGRAAWYLMLLTALSLTLLFDKIKTAKTRWLLLVPVLLAVSGFFAPPTFYRSYLPEAFDAVHQVAQKSDQTKEILIYSDIPELSSLADNLTIRSLNVADISQVCPERAECYLLIQSNYYSVDPILSQRANATGDNLEQLNRQTEEDRATFEANIAAIRSSAMFQKYTLIHETPLLKIYRQ